MNIITSCNFLLVLFKPVFQNRKSSLGNALKIAAHQITTGGHVRTCFHIFKTNIWMIRVGYSL